jgi:hypothetical protein
VEIQPTALSGLIILWALLKAAEVLFLCAAVLRHGDSLSIALAAWRKSGFGSDKYKAIEKQYKYLLTRDNWPFSRAFFRTPSPVRKLLVALFRFPTVVILLLVTLPMGPATLSHIGIYIMLALLWSYLLQVLASGFKLGHADYLVRRTAIAVPLTGPGKMPERPISTTQEFIKIFAAFFGLSVLGYASIYLALARFSLGAPAFEGKLAHPATFFDFVYFSVVTAATVGFGDILPVSAEARLLVMSQILLTFALVVLLVVEISLTNSYGEGE